MYLVVGMGSWWCCIQEILSLFTRRAKEEETERERVIISKPLPEELVADILSTLPADSLHQCAKVNKDWNSLFSTHYFNHDLFLPRASPTIIVHRSSTVEDELFYLDDFWGDDKKTPISLKIKDYPLIHWRTRLKLSCFGLLFFTNTLENHTVVLNPISQKTYFFHHGEVPSTICGVFFHPIAREICVLLVSFFLVSLEFKLIREQGAPRSWKTLSKASYLPMTEVPPVNLHGALHWTRAFKTPLCSPSIVVYSIVEEEFKLMPHPEVVPDRKMHLFDLDGNLALCQFADVLEIWTLEDYAGWFWTKTHSIKLKVLDHISRHHRVNVLGFQNGALIFHWLAIGIFACHIQQNTTKQFIFDRLKGFDAGTTAYLHTKSLVSLRDFQPSLEKHQSTRSCYPKFSQATRACIE